MLEVRKLLKRKKTGSISKATGDFKVCFVSLKTKSPPTLGYNSSELINHLKPFDCTGFV